MSSLPAPRRPLFSYLPPTTYHLPPPIVLTLDIRFGQSHNRKVKEKRKSVAVSLAADLAARFPWVPQGVSRPEVETTSSGVAAVDAVTCGLPRGSLVEICGERCSGRASLMIKALGVARDRGEACALVDASDAFDPESGQVGGVDLARLLWVRCARFDQAFRAAEWLLLGGGIGLLVLDLSLVPPIQLQHVPLQVWFRLRRAVEHTPTVLVALEQRPMAGTAASLVIELRAKSFRWSKTQSREGPAHSNLFAEKCIGVELVRARGGTNGGPVSGLWSASHPACCGVRLRTP